MDRGLDLVAAFLGHHARYYNVSGAGAVWERPNDSLDKPIDNLLSAVSAAVKLIGPSDKGRLPAASSGQAQINILTPSGLHFAQGPIPPFRTIALGAYACACMSAHAATD
jgi:hypothetical protein